MTSIVVIGSVNLDIVASADRLPAPGETVTGAELNHYPGGKGANQALAAARLGADVSMVGKVGQDSAADEALVLLREGGVDLTNCTSTPDVPTGVALISVAKSGENQIVVAPGANRALTAESLTIPAADALLCQLEVPTDTIAHAAQNFDGFFCVNLAPARQVDVTVLQRADLVIVNETEAAWYGDSLNACPGMIATTFGAAGAVLSKGGEDASRGLSMSNAKQLCNTKGCVPLDWDESASQWKLCRVLLATTLGKKHKVTKNHAQDLLCYK